VFDGHVGAEAEHGYRHCVEKTDTGQVYLTDQVGTATQAPDRLLEGQPEGGAEARTVSINPGRR
jgi:hypothetical protein